MLLGSLKNRDSDLDGDRDSADPSYFNQSYLGLKFAFLPSLALLSSPCFFCALLFHPLCLDPIINSNTIMDLDFAFALL